MKVEDKQNDSAACIDDVSLCNYALRKTSPHDDDIIEAHLEHCNVCLLKLREYLVIQTRFNDDLPHLKTPPELIEKVNDGWQAADLKKPSEKNIPHLIIKLAADGMKLLKESFLPGDLKIEWPTFSTPQPVFRSKEENLGKRKMAVKRTMKEKNVSMELTIETDVPESVDICILLKKFSNPMQYRQIALRRNGKIVRSKKTDAKGFVMFSQLRPASYLIQISDKHIEWKVDIML